MLSKLLFRRVEPFTCMAWALTLIAIAQPLAILSAGFWLSFVAVGLLLWWFTPWLTKTEQLHGKVQFFSVATLLSSACSFSRDGHSIIILYGPGLLAWPRW